MIRFIAFPTFFIISALLLLGTAPVESTGSVGIGITIAVNSAYTDKNGRSNLGKYIVVKAAPA